MLNICNKKLHFLKMLFLILEMDLLLCLGLVHIEILWVGLMMKLNKIYLNNVWKKQLLLN